MGQNLLAAILQRLGNAYRLSEVKLRQPIPTFVEEALGGGKRPTMKRGTVPNGNVYSVSGSRRIR